MNPQYEVKDIMSAVLKRWKLVCACALIFAIAAFIYSSCIAVPMYRATGSIYVNSVSVDSETNNISINTINASQKLANTCIEVLQSNSFLKSVIKRLNADITLGELKKGISVKSANETELLEISVTTTDAKMACKLANAILEMSKDEVARVIKAGDVEIVDDAGLPGKPVSPNTANNIIVCFILGLVLGGAAAFLIEVLNTKITCREDLAKHYDAVILGSVPSLKLKKQEGVHLRGKNK